MASNVSEYFTEEHISNTVRRSFLREFTPISTIVQSSPIEFHVAGAERLHLDLGKSYLYIRVKIVNSDDSNLTANDDVGPVNLSLHSLFSNVDVELCGKMVNDTNGLYPYRAYLETLLTFPSSCMESQLQSSGWYKDTGGRMEVFRMGDDGENLGFKKRGALFAQSREVELIGRPHCDLFNIGMTIPSCCNLMLRLHRSINSFLIKTSTTNEYKFVINDAKFLVQTEEMNADYLQQIEKQLQLRNIHLPLTRVSMKTLTVPRGQTTILHDNIYLGQIPERIIIALVRDTAMSGQHRQNPFNFHHFGLNFLALYVNGEIVPSRPFQPNFTQNLYLRDYLSLFSGTRTLFTDHTVSISRDDYATGYAIWAFDLSTDIECGVSLAPPRNGNVRVELKFAEATNETVNVICYAEFRSFIEIDKYRSVVLPRIAG